MCSFTARPVVYDPGPKQREKSVKVTPWSGLADLQARVRGLSKKDACDVLARNFPEKSRRRFVRNIERLTRLDPADFAAELYADPTPRAALRHLEVGGGRIG